MTTLAESDVTIKITGAAKPLENNILLTIGSLQTNDLKGFFFDNQINRAMKKSTQALGFYHAQYSYQINQDTLSIDIEPGKVVTWGPAHIQVSSDVALPREIQAVIDDHPFTPGKAINHNSYDAYKQRLFDTCLLFGFQGATFQHNELRINLDSDLATPNIEIKTGIRYKVADLHYTGTRLTPQLLNSLATMQKSDWYSRSLITKQYKSLLDTGYFKSVEIQPELDHQHGLVNITTTLEDAPSNQFLIGAGFGTDTGPRITLRWTKPLVNRYGHSLYSDLAVSKPVQELTASYQIPVGHPLERYVEWATGVQNKNVEDTESLRLTTGLNLHSRHNNWQQIIGVNLESEAYSQGEEDTQKTTYVLPTASWSYAAINPENEHSYRFLTNIQASTEDLYSDTNFFRITAGIKYFLPLTTTHALITRFKLGRLFNDDFDQVPSSKRFFTGGDQSIRGFQYESISPRDSNGDLIGGDHLNIASLEYRWLFKPQWAVAAFVDTGRVYFESSEPFRTGAGLGIRWLSPVGQISIDFAVPVNDDEYDGFQIHISMGPSI
ncbi:MAG: autotransporter assembly complex family protein [Spongiibacteraceae bacterium]